MQVTNSISKIKKATEGSKTTTATVIWLLMQIVNGIKPDAIPANIQVTIYNIVEILAAVGLLDKAWRKREVIINKIKKLWKKEKDS
jgi:hypothetical protein